MKSKRRLPDVSSHAKKAVVIGMAKGIVKVALAIGLILFASCESNVENSLDDSTSYSITASNDIEHGTVTAKPESAKAGETITLTITADEGYVLASLSAKDSNDNEISIAQIPEEIKESEITVTFIMPNTNITISATFKLKDDNTTDPEQEPQKEEPGEAQKEADGTYKIGSQTFIAKDGKVVVENEDGTETQVGTVSDDGTITITEGEKTTTISVEKSDDGKAAVTVKVEEKKDDGSVETKTYTGDISSGTLTNKENADDTIEVSKEVTENGENPENPEEPKDPEEPEQPKDPEEPEQPENPAEPIKYTVIFSVDGERVSAQEIEEKKTVAEPEAPVKAGYTFGGWYTDEDLTKVFDFANLITANTTLYAKWNINNYTVTFSTNGGSDVAAQNVDYNKSATEPTAPTKTGYTFAGWYSDSALTKGFSFTAPITANTTLYAKWSINSYTVTFSTDGGSDVTAQSVDYNTAATTPTTPTKTGYTFGGWYSDSALTKAFSFTTPITADTTLYAKWTINSYTVTFSTDGGSDVVSQSVDYNTAATTPTAPTKTGYTFADWYSDSALTKAFSFTAPITADTTLYAKWTINSYTVTFSTDGGSDVTAQSVEYNAVATTPAVPTKTGYTFGGWYSDSALTKAFSFTSPITAATTLYAKWLPATNTAYTVYHYKENANDDKYTLADTENKTGTTLEQTQASAKSYEHFTAATVTQSQIKADGSTEVSIYYTRETATVTIDLDGGAINGSKQKITRSGKWGQTFEALPEPSRQGYTFLGWNEKDGTLPQTFGEITSFKAVWIENSLSPISITLGKIESDAEVELILDENKVFTATPGFAKYQWRVDGRIQMNSGNTLDMKAGLTEFNKTAGHHNVMLIVTDQDGNFYTAEATYTIVSSGGNFVVIKE